MLAFCVVAAALYAGREAGRPWLHWIQATLGNTLRFIPVEDVRYCRSEGKYTCVVAADADALLRRSLTALLENLDPEVFWQVHRGIAVNIRHIDAVIRREGGALVVRMRGGGEELPVSKTHQGRFRGM